MNWLQQVYLVFSRSRAPLYHFTTLESAYDILKSNTLKAYAPDDEDIKRSISFTRDKNEWLDKAGLISTWDQIAIQFTVNQDKLRNNYKVQPFEWMDIEDDDATPRSENQSESEERVYRDIKNFDSYIESISIPKTISIFEAFTMDEGEYFHKLIVRKSKKIIDSFQKKMAKYNLTPLNFGEKLVTNKRDASYSPILENNDVFHMRYLLKNQKLDSKSRKLAKNFIKNRLKIIDKAVKIAKI